MKISTFTKSVFLVFFMMLVNLQINGQNIGVVEELEFLPNPPNNVEITNLRVATKWYNHNNGFISSEVILDGNHITLKMCYFIQELQGISYVDDTVTLGQLASGNFNLVIDFYRNSACDSKAFSDTLQFQVTQSTATQMTPWEAGITLHPNPFKDHFTIHAEANVQHRPVSLRLYDYSGREVFYREMESRANHTISTEHLPPGVYLYRMELENGQEVIGKMVKH